MPSPNLARRGHRVPVLVFPMAGRMLSTLRPKERALRSKPRSINHRVAVGADEGLGAHAGVITPV